MRVGLSGLNSKINATSPTCRQTPSGENVVKLMFSVLLFCWTWTKMSLNFPYKPDRFSKRKEMAIRSWTPPALFQISLVSTRVNFLRSEKLSSKAPFFHHLISLCQLGATNTTDTSWVGEITLDKNALSGVRRTCTTPTTRPAFPFHRPHLLKGNLEIKDEAGKTSNANPASPRVWSNPQHLP